MPMWNHNVVWVCVCVCVCVRLKLPFGVVRTSSSTTVQTIAYPDFTVAAPSLSYRSKAMERSRRPWTRRDDKKRDHRDDFDEFLEKKKRELADFKEDADRLRTERNKSRAEIDRLRAELDRKDADLAHLEQQSKETSERQTKRVKAALDSVFEVLAAPAVTEEGDATDPSEEDGAGDEDPPRPSLPEDTTATGPGGAAPAPKSEEGEVQEQALEQAARSRSETPPALGQ